MNKAKFVAGLLLVGITAVTAVPAFAVPFDNRPKILVHVKSTTTKNACTFGSAGITNCADPAQVTVKGTLTPLNGPGYYYIYLLVAKGSLDNLAGLQCGIAYQNNNAADNGDREKIDVFGWTLCAKLEFISPGTNAWPKPGGGNLITWDSSTECQTGEVAVAGYFYAAAYNNPDFFAVTPRPVDGVAKVARCNNAETTLAASDLGWAQFSAGATTAGCNPCIMLCPPVAVEETTWGGIKSLYSN